MNTIKTHQNAPPNSFFSKHFAQARRLCFWRNVFLKGGVISYTGSMLCVLLGHSFVAKWVFGDAGIIQTSVVFVNLVLIMIAVQMVFRSICEKWFKRHGYTVEKTSDLQIAKVKKQKTQKVYQIFTQLPSTVENMLFEKRLHKLKEKNQLPLCWWNELENELEKHTNTLQSVIVENQTEHTPSILTTWNSKPNPQE